MKKILFLLLFFSIFLYADVYYAKLEPVESYAIKSSVSGEVLFSDLEKEGTFVNDSVIIKLDDAVDRDDLKTSQKKLNYLKQMQKLTEQNVKNLEKSYLIKKRNYNRIKNLKTKSNYEKDNQLVTLIAANSSLLSAKQSLVNLKSQINDLEYKIFALRDKISKKSIRVKNRYIYKLNVKKGDYVNPGLELIKTMDTTKAKATIYLSYEDMSNLNKRTLYINGKKSDLKFKKVWKIADSVNISSYKAELILPKPKQFSRVIKIELK